MQVRSLPSHSRGCGGYCSPAKRDSSRWRICEGWLVGWLAFSCGAIVFISGPVRLRDDDSVEVVEDLLADAWKRHAPSLLRSLLVAFGGKMYHSPFPYLVVNLINAFRLMAATFKMVQDCLQFVPPILLPYIIMSVGDLSQVGLHDGLMLVSLLVRRHGPPILSDG